MPSFQVNVRLTPEQGVEFDRWAAELGVERAKLGKDILAEALAARREGRASFERPEALGPGDVVAMKAVLDQGLMEIDRIATAWASHESELQRQERDDQQALEHARIEFIQGIPDRIKDRIKAANEAFAGFLQRLEKQPRLEAVETALRDNTAAMTKLLEQPRTLINYSFWDKKHPVRLHLAVLAIGWII